MLTLLRKPNFYIFADVCQVFPEYTLIDSIEVGAKPISSTSGDSNTISENRYRIDGFLEGYKMHKLTVYATSFPLKDIQLEMV